MTTKTITIHGQSVTVRTPFAAGHVLTEGEAKQLNQVRVENVRNNQASKLKEAIDSGDAAKLTEALSAFDAYDASYEMTLSNVGSGTRTLDPIGREARALAKAQIEAHLAKTNRSLRKVPDGETAESWKEKTEAKIDEVAAMEPVIEQAKKNVAARQKASDKLAEAINLD